jgi:small ligand-binding sensory domain FIST
VNGWLAFIDPFHMDAEAWLRSWNVNYPSLPVYGGLASGNFPEPLTQIYLDGEVFEDGGVAVAVGGDVALNGVVAQGCTPIGETWTLTRVEQNLIRHIGNRPAYAVLAETVNQLPPAEQQQARRAICSSASSSMNTLRIFIAAISWCANLIGGDPNSGVLGRGRVAARRPDHPVSAP